MVTLKNQAFRLTRKMEACNSGTVKLNVVYNERPNISLKLKPTTTNKLFVKRYGN